MEVDALASKKRGASIALPDDLDSEEPLSRLSSLEIPADQPPLLLAYGYTQQPLSSLATQVPSNDTYAAQYTTGIFSWSAAYQHGGFVEGRVWASGLQWPQSYRKEAAVELSVCIAVR